jgi:hypothetical protein
MWRLTCFFVALAPFGWAGYSVVTGLDQLTVDPSGLRRAAWLDHLRPRRPRHARMPDLLIEQAWRCIVMRSPPCSLAVIEPAPDVRLTRHFVLPPSEPIQIE